VGWGGGGGGDVAEGSEADVLALWHAAG